MRTVTLIPAPTDADPLLRLPGGALRVWPVTVLRGAGFGVDSLIELGDPGYAAAIDAMSAAEVAAGGPVVDAAERRQHDRLAAVAGRLDLQEAIAWQNPAVLRDSVRPLAAAVNPVLNQSMRRKERILAKYWARYCAKNDTIGFFGPVCWADLRTSGPFASVRVGAELTDRRTVYLEPWATDALAAAFSADPRVRPWIAPRRNPATYLHDGRVLLTEGPPEDVTEAELRLLEACTGRSARDLAAGFAGAGFPDADAVYAALDRFVESGYLLWDLEPALMLRPQPVLRASLAVIGDPGLRAELESALDRIDADLAAVAAVDKVDDLDAALARLDATFSELAGTAPSRREGEVYGGRRLTYLDSRRDAQVEFGPGFLDRLGPPLSLLSWSLRSFTSELSERYEEAFLGAYGIIKASGEVDRVWLAHLLGVCAREIFEPGYRVFEPVLESFARRWERILGFDGYDEAAGGPIELSSAELWPAVRAEFGAAAPGWIQALQHSADVQICAASAEALADGDCRLVLGELHAAWNTLEAGVFVDQHDDPGYLAHLLEHSVPAGRVGLVPVKHHPRVLARTMPAIVDERQWWLALTRYQGGDPARRINFAELYVERRPDGVWCRSDDGRAELRVLDVLGMLVSAEIMDACKLIGKERAHVPRTTVDGLVVVRESWTVPLTEVELPGNRASEASCFRAVRAWAARLGLPRFVFVKIPRKLKPFYLDLTSSVQVAAFVTMLRHAVATKEPGERVRFTEMLPSPEEAWLTGPAGERYTTELRIVVVDQAEDW